MKNFTFAYGRFKKTILHFAFCIFPLIFIACHSPRGNDTSAYESVVAADTLITATGNAELDSLLQATSSRRPPRYEPCIAVLQNCRNIQEQ